MNCNEDRVTLCENGARLILVVDDEDTVLRLVVDILEQTGYRTLCAPDGETAISTFQDHADEIACVILDLTMPGMDGAAIFREMKRLSPQVRVILCSGFDERHITQRFPGERPSAFIKKPFGVKDLLAKVAQALAGRP